MPTSMPIPTQTLHIGFLFLDPHLGRGGLENVLMNITKGLKAENILASVYMLDPATHPEFLKDMVSVHVAKERSRLKQLRPHLPTFLARITDKAILMLKVKDVCRQIEREKQLDALVILDLTDSYNLAAPIIEKTIKRLNIPLISWPHGTLSLTKPKTAAKLRHTMNLFDAHFAISHGIAGELKETYRQENIKIIYNPIESAEIIERDPVQFLFLGRIADPVKRVKPMIEMLQKLQGDWKLDIYGSAGTIEADEAFRQYLLQVDPEKHIRFHGWHENPWSVIDKGGVLLLNSTNEGFSLVLAEAMMRGIACVSTNCPVGPSEIVQNDENGWLFDVNDIDQCQVILQEIIDGKRLLPPQEQVQASVQKFSLEKVILNFKNNLIELIEKR